MGIEQALFDQFKSLNIDKENVSSEVVAKCVSLCTEYNLTGEEFMNQWIAFTLSNTVDVEPTIQSLSLLERKKLAPAQKTKNASTPARKAPSLNGYYSTPKAILSDEVAADYLPKSGTPQTPKSTKRHLQESYLQDESPKRIQIKNTGSSLSGNFFASRLFSKFSTVPSTKYFERVNSGQILESFGNLDRLNSMIWRGRNHNIIINKNIPKEQNYMLDDLRERWAGEVKRIKNLAEAIIETNNLKEYPIAQEPIVSTPSLFVGRVWDVALNKQLISVEMAIAGMINYGQRVPVKIKDLEQFSLYVGQVIVILGKNPTGKEIFAQNIYGDGHAPFPQTFLKGPTPIQMVVACGPFTLSDNMLYDPLGDLVENITKSKPDVAIFVGPFVDCDHPDIMKLAEGFKEHFERLIDTIMEPLANENTQVVLIPSFRDMHHTPVYPTPPFQITKRYRNLHLCADPALININGISVAATSFDVLRQISLKEQARGQKSGDRIVRLVSHIFEQRCILPSRPDSQEVNFDGGLFHKYGIFKETPHILIVPSKMKYFIRNVNDCVVINPEILGKGVNGGTYARLEVSPMREPGSIVNNIACQILRI